MEAWDRALFLLVHEGQRNRLFDALFPALYRSKVAFLALLGIALLALLVWGGPRGRVAAISTLAALLLADQGTQLAKGLVQRIRPCHVLPGVQSLVACTASFSLPSNHASNAFALASLLGGHYPRLIPLALAAAALIAYGRVYVGVHYPLDVAAGALWGAAVGCLLVLVGRRLLARWEPGPPPQP